MHALHIPLGQFRVGSHRLRVEIDHQVDKLDRLCQVCHLQEVETEVHIILGCAVYYEIRRRFHCLFRDYRTLAQFFRYPNQRCLALYMQEALRFRAHILQPPIRPDPTQRITTFFKLLPLDRGTKRSIHTSTYPDSRLVRIRGTSPCYTRSHQQFRLKSVPGRQTRSSSIQQRVNPPRKRFSGQSALAIGFSSGQQSWLSFFSVIHSASDVKRDGSDPQTY